jgi:hypothetical protein
MSFLNLPPLTDVQAAYLAGFLDGEGHFGINRHKRKDNCSGYRYGGSIRVSQTEQDVMKFIQSFAGGAMGFCTGKGNNKDQWNLFWSPNACRWLLPQIRPYLIRKAEIADVLQEFLDNVRARENYGRTDTEKQNDLYNRAKYLNQRGIERDEPAETPEIRPYITKPVGVCSVEGCDEPHYARGVCYKHYRRKYVNKNPDVERGCEHCGTPLIDVRPDVKYCGHSCRMKAYRRRNRLATANIT